MDDAYSREHLYRFNSGWLSLKKEEFISMKDVKKRRFSLFQYRIPPPKESIKNVGESPLVDKHSGSLRIRQSPCVTH
jgi:hypothetical protein